MISNFNNALHDIRSIVYKRHIWLHLGFNDIRMRYIGTMIGPWWITLSLCMLIGAFSLVYGRLLHQSLPEYIPFLTAGLLVWTFIATVLVDSCDMFMNAREYLNTLSLPYSLFLYRVMWRNLLIFAHNFVVYLIVIAYFHKWPGVTLLWFIPGALLVVLCLTFSALIIGMIATRYRDIPPIIAAMIQIIFFVSPITWLPNLMGERSLILCVNPVNYFLDLTRSPMLGNTPELLSFVVVTALTLILGVIAITAFSNKRHLIPFWL